MSGAGVTWSPSAVVWQCTPGVWEYDLYRTRDGADRAAGFLPTHLAPVGLAVVPTVRAEDATGHVIVGPVGQILRVVEVTVGSASVGVTGQVWRRGGWLPTAVNLALGGVYAVMPSPRPAAPTSPERLVSNA